MLNPDPVSQSPKKLSGKTANHEHHLPFPKTVKTPCAGQTDTSTQGGRGLSASELMPREAMTATGFMSPPYKPSSTSPPTCQAS